MKGVPYRPRPEGRYLRFARTAARLIETFGTSFLPRSFGLAAGQMIDAVPGRMTETWFKAEREGIYHGMCPKLCGKDHSNLPIAFRGLSEECYAAWLAGTSKKCAATDPATGRFAANDAATAERP